MSDDLMKEEGRTSNEDVINEMTRDIESLAVKQVERETINCNKDNALPEIRLQDDRKELLEDSCNSSEEEMYEKVDDNDYNFDYSLDEIQLKEIEEALSDEEKEIRKNAAILKKSQGNELFRSGDFSRALYLYTEGLNICPLIHKTERSVIFCNRAAAKIKLERFKSALDDCNKAIDLNPEYLRAINRRAVLKEELGQLDEALADWKLILHLQPNHKDANVALQRLPPRIAEQNEKLKAEMFGKLKSLGNMVLQPFGLSTENFKMVQNNDGGYSVHFEQNQ